MNFDVRMYIVVGIFIIICISMMIFNFAIIYYGQGHNTPSARKIKKWRGILIRETIMSFGGKPKHEKRLLKKLPKSGNLLAYSLALQSLRDSSSEAYSYYMLKKNSVFQRLADTYSRKDSIDRACYADFVSNFPEVAGSRRQLVDTLISYIDGTGVHCRVNVLRALCSIGNVEGVTNALQVISDQSLFVHNQILTNELLNFRGNKELLGKYLFSESKNWNDNITVSVIQFITSISSRYGEALMPILQNSSTNTEVRAAIIRYHGKHTYEPSRPTLVEFIVNSTDINLAIEAASALALYPAPETVSALKCALSSSNWYIRYNSSSALVKLFGKTELHEILQSESNYEKEIVYYLLEQETTSQNNDLHKDVDGEKICAWRILYENSYTL